VSDPAATTVEWIDAMQAAGDLTPFELLKWAAHGIAAATGRVISPDDYARVISENEATLSELAQARIETEFVCIIDS
jgi:hypothetical protein